MSILFTGQNRVELAETTSTNTFATEFLTQAPPEGTMVLAKKQTAGRGQKGTKWDSQPGENLTFSIIYYPVFLSAQELFYVSKMVAYALYKTLVHFLPKERIEIKWPNDLLANRKKLAGILIENQLEGRKIKSAVIGMGLNVNQKDFGQVLSQKATSMRLESGNTFDTDEVLSYLLSSLEAEYLALRQGKMDHLNRHYLNALYGYQSVVRLRIDSEEKDLMVIGVEKGGKLAVEEDRKVRYFDIKEVAFVL